MSNRLPSTRTIPTPAQVEARISALHGRLEAHPVLPTRYSVRRDRAATTAERRVLSDVAERLNAELSAASNPAHVDVVVTRVLLGFEQGRGRGDDENEVLIAEYVSALKDLPLAAIHAAAERFRSGDTLLPWSKRFRPSPAEFAAETRGGLIPLRTRLLHIRRVLEAGSTTCRRRLSARKSPRRPRRICNACARPSRNATVPRRRPRSRRRNGRS